jgi:hypothetical protein
MANSLPAWAVVLAIVALLLASLVAYLVFATRRLSRLRAARDAELAERGSALGLAPVAATPGEVLAALRPAALLPGDSSELHALLRGQREGHEVTFFDYAWTVVGSRGRWAGRPLWNAERLGRTSGGTPTRRCALAVAAVATRVRLPAFLLEPNPVLPLREHEARAVAALEPSGGMPQDERAREVLAGPAGGMLHDLLAQAQTYAEKLPDPPGLRFDERPAFYAQCCLAGEDEPALRALFRPDLLDFFLTRPGWLVNSIQGHVLVSLDLGEWPSTREAQRRIPLGVTRWLPAEHLRALIDGALEIVRKLEEAAS